MANGGRMDASRGIGGAPGPATSHGGPSLRYGRWRTGGETKPIETRIRARSGQRNGAGRRRIERRHRRSCGCGGARCSPYDADSRRDACRKQLFLGGIAVADQEYSIRERNGDSTGRGDGQVKAAVCDGRPMQLVVDRKSSIIRQRSMFNDQLSRIAGHESQVIDRW